jgi:hypothetical protein
MRRDGACIPMQGAVSRQGRAACGAERVSGASSSLGARSPQEKYTTGCALSICADVRPARLQRAGAAATGARRARRSSPAMTAPPTPAPTLFTRRARPSPHRRSRQGERRRFSRDTSGSASQGGGKPHTGSARGRALAGASVRGVPALSRQTARGLGGGASAAQGRHEKVAGALFREGSRVGTGGCLRQSGERPTVPACGR